MGPDVNEKVARVLRDPVIVVPYDPQWPILFEQESRHLRLCLPSDRTGRIEHFGSTAVPGMCAKPIVDMLVEVSSLDEVRRLVPPALKSQGYDYFWRPTWGDDIAPFYAWFIKRDAGGQRTHHIHMVESHFEHWDRLLFRDYLIEYPETARAYGELKWTLVKTCGHDRVAYTQAKTAFVQSVMAKAARHFKRSGF